MAEITPMMRQYLEIKEQHNDCILFFRLGDFYEMFCEDAKVASKELDLTLTTRDRAKENPEERTPMCGVPYHSSEAYIARLTAKGYKVAICEQTEDPATAKGLVDRAVIRVITPGTLIESSMLEEGKSNYLGSVYLSPRGAAVAFTDISTGEICATSFPNGELSHIYNELGRFSPAEVIINEEAANTTGLREFLTQRLDALVETADGRFAEDAARENLCRQFKVSSPEELGLKEEPAAVCAVGGLLSYLIETQKTDLSHLSSLDFYSEGRYMELDIQTVRNLELVSTLRTGEKKGSLLWVLDKTKTPMGSRLMRSWLSRPLLSPGAIRRRHKAVEELVKNSVQRSELILTLRRIGDIERLIGNIVYGTAGGRDLYALAASIHNLPELKAGLSSFGGALLSELSAFDELSDIMDLIDAAITDDPPFSVREGNVIRAGYHPEVDRLRSLLKGSNEALAAIEAKERERTGKKLKVSYNKVFGYYIEIPRSMSSDVPGDYIRKQTLTNCERFITQELKELETELLTAKDRLADLEYRLFTEVREKIAGEVLRVQNTAACVASIDCLCSFAHVAADQGYCMPEIDLSGALEIRDGRHPVVEAMQKDTLFVPNDVNLSTHGDRTAIITGPNMAGKSTYMRQTALIVLMAQIGSFVPARSAHIGLVDRVFTRIGASDDLSAGKSTFMVEMTEVSEILSNATRDSLLILDEIGRGTSTYDGMSIARAVVEYCNDPRKIGAKTLFATHYHELTVLEGQIPGIRNYNITAKKRGGSLIFLRKIVPGGADDSYGIEVAGLAGLPDTVIKRAKDVLSAIVEENGLPSTAKPAPKEDSGQISLLSMEENEIARTLRTTDLNTITPLEALNLLYELKKKVHS